MSIVMGMPTPYNEGWCSDSWRLLPWPALEPEAVLPHQQGAATELITFDGAKTN